MTASWYVCKYVKDLMRDEPRNLGVIVHDDHGALCARFVGQREDGTVDGRRAQGLVNSVETYKLWVKHWQGLQCTDGLLAAEPRRVDDNYFLSGRTTTLLGADTQTSMDELANRLFASLVAETPELVETLKDQIETCFRHLNVVDQVQSDTSVAVKVGDAIDTLRFDYRYIGKTTPALMKRINLATTDQRAWNDVHAASWMFTNVHNDDHYKNDSRIALVRTGAMDRKRQLSQMRVLSKVSEIIDFSENAAEQKLATLLI